jgi:ABC-type multidrug transport system ATPase subunit/aryl carrier-like protein
MYSGRFRLPRGTPLYEIEDLADDVLASLGLSRKANSIVGDVTRRGVSGGEKKRVNIGLELMARPTALFLDEPTSGLDASSALLVMKSLEQLVRNDDVTVCSVIHQPRKFIFDLFDSLILLGTGGRMVYHGPVEEAESYFKDLGFVLPPGESLADWYIDISTGRISVKDFNGNQNGVDEERGHHSIHLGQPSQISNADTPPMQSGSSLGSQPLASPMLLPPSIRGISADSRSQAPTVENIQEEDDEESGESFRPKDKKEETPSGHALSFLSVALEEPRHPNTSTRSPLSSDSNLQRPMSKKSLMSLRMMQMSHRFGMEHGVDIEAHLLKEPTLRDTQSISPAGLSSTNQDKVGDEAKLRRELLYDSWEEHFESLEEEEMQMYQPPESSELPQHTTMPGFFLQFRLQMNRIFLLAWRNRVAKTIETAIIVIAVALITVFDGTVEPTRGWQPLIPFEVFISGQRAVQAAFFPQLFEGALKASAGYVRYGVSIGVIGAVLIGLTATKALTDKRLEFYR